MVIFFSTFLQNNKPFYVIFEQFKNVQNTLRVQQPKSANWRIVIPNLTQYKEASPQQLYNLKCLILERLKHRPQLKTSNIKSQFDRGLRYYHIALEHHVNGVPHLDILLIYDKSIRRQLVDYDYLLKHGDITTYKKINQAIIDYGKKQDKEALSNIPPETKQVSIAHQDGSITTHTVNSLIQVQQLKKDSYSYLYDRMKQDPLRFNLEQYVQKHQLSKHISGWSSIKTKLKDMQVAAANLQLKQKKGFKHINRALIEANLNSEELKTYDSWPGYQTIVDKLNQMILLKGDRDPKTLNLLITGAPNSGKSALVWHPKQHPPAPYNPLSSYCSIYPMGMSQWFPVYKSDVYHCIYWNEAKLTSYSYDTILKLLDGSPMDLPNKGSVSRKVDNPLIIMTSNLTLEQMIQQKFSYSKDYINQARRNLAVRVKNVIIPNGYDLFLLQKLLTPYDS